MNPDMEFEPKPDTLLTREEWETYSFLSDAWNAFINLEKLHVEDSKEFAFHINAAKNIVMSRPVSRELRDLDTPGYVKPKSENDTTD